MSSRNYAEEDLAYGSYGQGGSSSQAEQTDRGFFGDLGSKMQRPQGQNQGQGQGQGQQSSQQPSVTQMYQPQLYGQSQNQQIRPEPAAQGYSGQHSSSGGGSFLMGKLSSAIYEVGSEIKTKLSGPSEVHSHTHSSGVCVPGAHDGHRHNRFMSFAPERATGNVVKWYVDACSYMWAVSVALEQARQSIWILDWWLSPELYLRRPPAKFEQYRLDHMLKAAAEKGVKVNIIVYKEVTQALTLCSFHTKHALEGLHPNIAVFRHPDHLPDTQVLNSSFFSSLQNIKLNAATAGQLPGDALKAIYGVTEDTVLYWAHHEKLCIVDGRTAFMGGIDLCYGRWDTNQHSIADCHPSDINMVHFPGQDYNNARIMDFQDVTNWQRNKLDRTKYPRMGWTDLSISLQGSAVDDLMEHFIQRWNFIFHEKYNLKDDSGRYQRLAYVQPPGVAPNSYPQFKQPNIQQPGSPTVPATSYGGLGGQQQPLPGTHQGLQSSQYFPSPPTQSFAQQSTNAQNNQAEAAAPSYGYQGSTSVGTTSTTQPTGIASLSSWQAPGFHAHQQQQVSHYGGFPPPPSGAPTTTDIYGSQPSTSQQYGAASAQTYQHPESGTNLPYFAPPPGRQPEGQRGFEEFGYRHTDARDTAASESERGFLSSGSGTRPSGRPTSSSGKASGSIRDQLMQKAQQGLQQFDSRYGSQIQGGLQKLDSRLGTHTTQYGNQILSQYGQGNQAYEQYLEQRTGISCQIVRSVSRWSHGVAVEHSIANAYIEIIKRSQHFVYIENQFFITATHDDQKPIKNKIGAAIVERVLRAARSRQKFKVIVCMPAIPAFAGDLRSDDALSTRAIMEFQYNSISRGGHSIYQSIAKEGFNPLDYIRFYNLRSYDRINASAAMAQAERQSGVSYVQAQQQYDQRYAPGPAYGQGPGGLVTSESGTGGIAALQTMARSLGDDTDRTRGVSGDTSSGGVYDAYRPPQTQSQQQPTSTTEFGGYAAYNPAGSQQQPGQTGSYGQTLMQQSESSSASAIPSSQVSGTGYGGTIHSSNAATGQQSGFAGHSTLGQYGSETTTQISSQQQQLQGSLSGPSLTSAGRFQASQYSNQSPTVSGTSHGYDGSGPPIGPVEAPGYIPGYGDANSPFGSGHLQQQPAQQYGANQAQGNLPTPSPSMSASAGAASPAGFPQQPGLQSSAAPTQYAIPNADRYNQPAATLGTPQLAQYGQQPQPQSFVQPLPGQQMQQQAQAQAQPYNKASTDPYQQYQAAAAQSGAAGSTEYDTVAQCYMENGRDIRQIPWTQGDGQSEIDAFVSEELYIHSKVLIADDRIVIIGSANLNDRSQLGDHDSEIACIIEDSSLVDATMNGRPWKAGRFPASLRRTLFRKHLGLLKPQDSESPTNNFYPASLGYGAAGPANSENDYDWGSTEDLQVADPLDQRFENMWNAIAHDNTEVYAKVFHAIPHDGVRTWQQYDDWYERYFRSPDSKDVKEGRKRPGLYLECHVVKENFAEGQAGTTAVKEELSKIRGTLVEMPLVFLKDEDIAKEGLGLNAFTEEVYT